ncbi:hypothetical protein FRC12_021732 [Ceratobasidium sp. 428]|nr:hypothetical protein FRC12_021732 [Ceratobasidium sp. 428]
MDPESTDVSYTLGSEADAEPDLDELEYISPASPPSSTVEQDSPSPCNLGNDDPMPEHDNTPDNQDPPPVITAEQPSSNSELLDALHAF